MADIELLPPPEKVFVDKHIPTGVRIYAYDAATLSDYARANVEHHAEKLRTEIEALRVRADAMAGEAVKHEARAERLEAALRVLLPFADHADSCGDHDAYNQAAVRTCGCGLDSFRDQAEAALRDHEQEAPQ